MRETWTAAPLAHVRHVIARESIRDGSLSDRLGEITLRPHQRRAAARLLEIISRRGGAMLAEPVGVGKTYTALGVAAQHGGPILVVAPAALRSMWRDAATRCGMILTVVTYEALSRGSMPDIVPSFVILDEAHRLRSPNTRRYAAIAHVARGARILLVTATPVHNRRDDLAAQLALFLGRVAWQLSDDALAECVVRGPESPLGTRPRLNGPYRVELGGRDDCLDQLVALPDPVPARDESTAGMLLMYGFLHQWTSSRAALVAALRRRHARGFALIAALEAGNLPSRAELSAWTQAEDAMQLAFPEIVSHATPTTTDAGALLVAVDRHNAAIEALLRAIRISPDPDDARSTALAKIRASHPDARIIAFCQYEETVNALWSRLSREPGVAALTARGARVAGGRISRDSVINQFSPPDPRRAGTSRTQRIDLLITTDLLSEGLNLQEASVIVHLDLPWNPARLDQRVGRALRLGSSHAAVTVYMMAPPAPVEQLIRVEARLRDKLTVAQRVVGVAGRILPSPVGEQAREGALAEQRGAYEATLRGWSLASGDVARVDACIVSAVASDHAGFLALVRNGDDRTFVADVGRGPGSDVSIIASATAQVDIGREVEVRAARATEVLGIVERWVDARRASATIDLGAVTAARARRTALTRVAQALARAPRHRRAGLTALADAARAVASATLSEGAERILEALVGAELPDEAWLRSIAAFGELNVRTAPVDTSSDRATRVVALVILDPGVTN